MAEIASVLRDNNLSIEATELEVSREFEGALSVRGAIDLVARDVSAHR